MTLNTSEHHKRVVGKRSLLQNPGNAPMDHYLRELSQAEKQRRRALINTAQFMAKEDIAMAKFPKLFDLQSKNGVDMGKFGQAICDRSLPDRAIKPNKVVEA